VSGLLAGNVAFLYSLNLVEFESTEKAAILRYVL